MPRSNAPARVIPVATCAVLLALAVAASPASPRAQSAGGVPDAPTAQPALRSTQDGVFTLAQANQGKDLFAGYCQSCHTPTVHAGPPFRNKWFGRTLGELFGYMRREMPKTDPGSLGDEEYAMLLAYLMRINGMPTGSTPLAADSAALQRIRIDSLPRTTAAPTSVPTSPDHRR